MSDEWIEVGMNSREREYVQEQNDSLLFMYEIMRNIKYTREKSSPVCV